jgi:hypothetical protein
MLYEERSRVLAALTSIGSMLLARTAVETIPAARGRVVVAVAGT